MQQLWACGFNAWGQLDFPSDDRGGLSTNSSDVAGQLPVNRNDIEDFQCVLKNSRIEILKTSFSALLVRIHDRVITAGSASSYLNYLRSGDCPIPIEHTAQALNDKFATFERDSLNTYESQGGAIPINQTPSEDIISIVANDSSFYALTQSGKVFSWGDARHGASLGREITKECPAESPGLIESLCSYPITGVQKIAAGGYFAGALTSDNDLYLWGGRQGQDTPFDGMVELPDATDIEGEDILDFDVGDRHFIALTESYRLWVLGNFNGKGGPDVQLKSWEEIKLPLEEYQKIVKVYAGYRNSFAVVE